MRRVIEETLLPCLCGGAGNLTYIHTEHSSMKLWKVKCKECDKSTRYCNERINAINQWNEGDIS